MRKFFFTSIAVVAVFFVFTAVSANAATLQISPSTGTQLVVSVFTVTLLLDTESAGADGVDVHYLRYDPAFLEVQGTTITSGTLFPNTNTNAVNAQIGAIDFSQVSSGGSQFTGQGALATIQFKALKAGTTNLTLDFTPNATTDTNVSSFGSDVLASVTNAQFTITAGQPPPDGGGGGGGGGGGSSPQQVTISNIKTENIDAKTTKISWTTDQPTKGEVQYGATQQTLKDSVLTTITNATTHEVVLSNLTPQTTYYFQIIGTGSENQKTTTAIQTFITGEAGTPTPTFPDGTLVKSKQASTVYVIEKNKKRKIASEAVFLSRGFKWSAIIVITQQQIDAIPDGAPLTDTTINTVDEAFPQASSVSIKQSQKDNQVRVTLSWVNPTDANIIKVALFRSDTRCSKGDVITSRDTTRADPITYEDTLPKEGEYFYSISPINKQGKESMRVTQWSNASGKMVAYITKFAAQDRDCDGLANEREKLYGINPDNSDTDGDSFLDGIEVEFGYDPRAPKKKLWDRTFAERFKGRILFAPHFNGEAYYVHMEDAKAYYLNRPQDAFNIMRTLGVGITNADLAKIPKYDDSKKTQGDKKLQDRLAGKILLQVESLGEAWYVEPRTKERYFLGRPQDAFNIMRSLATGVSNEDLIKFALKF